MRSSTPAPTASNTRTAAAPAPAPAAGRPLRADARRNRERILQAALAEFSSSGVDAHMDAIASRAGVGVGTVYRHFPTKDALFVQLIRSRFEEFVEVAHGALEIADPWQAFSSFMHANAERCAGDAGTQSVFRQIDPDVAPRMAAETGLLALAQRLIDRGQSAGVIRPDFGAEDIGMIMCGVTSAMHHGNPSWDWRRHLGFVLDGLRTRPG